MMSNAKLAIKRTLTFLLAFAMVVTSLYVAPVTAKADEVVEEVVEEAAGSTVVEEVSEAVQNDAVVNEEIVEETIVEENTQIEADKLNIGGETVTTSRTYWIGWKGRSASDPAKIQAYDIAMQDTYAKGALEVLKLIYGTINTEADVGEYATTLNGTYLKVAESNDKGVINEEEDADGENMDAVNSRVNVSTGKESTPQLVAYITSLQYGDREAVTFGTTDDDVLLLADRVEDYISGGSPRVADGIVPGEVLTVKIQLDRVERSLGKEGAHEKLAENELKFRFRNVANKTLVVNKGESDIIPLEIKDSSGVAEQVKSKLVTLVKADAPTGAGREGNPVNSQDPEEDTVSVKTAVNKWGAQTTGKSISLDWVKVEGEDIVYSEEKVDTSDKIVDDSAALAALDKMTAGKKAEIRFRVDTYEAGPKFKGLDEMGYGRATVTVKAAGGTSVELTGDAVTNSEKIDTLTKTAASETGGVLGELADCGSAGNYSTQDAGTVDLKNYKNSEGPALPVFDEKILDIKFENISNLPTSVVGSPADGTYYFGVLRITGAYDSTGKLLGTGENGVINAIKALDPVNNSIKIGYKVYPYQCVVSGSEKAIAFSAVDGFAPTAELKTTLTLKADTNDFRIKAVPSSALEVEVLGGGEMANVGKAMVASTSGLSVEMSNGTNWSGAEITAIAAGSGAGVVAAGGGAAAQGDVAIGIKKIYLESDNSVGLFKDADLTKNNIEKFLKGESVELADKTKISGPEIGSTVVIDFVVDRLGAGAVITPSNGVSNVKSVKIKTKAADKKVTVSEVPVIKVAAVGDNGEKTADEVLKKVAEAVEKIGVTIGASNSTNASTYNVAKNAKVVSSTDEMVTEGGYYWKITTSETYNTSAQDLKKPVDLGEGAFAITLMQGGAGARPGNGIGVAAATPLDGITGTFKANVTITPVAGTIDQDKTRVYGNIDIAQTPDEKTANETARKSFEEQLLEGLKVYAWNSEGVSEVVDPAFYKIAYTKTAPGFSTGGNFKNASNGNIYYNIFISNLGFYYTGGNWSTPNAVTAGAASNLETAIGQNLRVDGSIEQGHTDVKIEIYPAAKEEKPADATAKTPEGVSTAFSVMGEKYYLDGKLMKYAYRVHERYQLADEQTLGLIAANKVPVASFQNNVITIPVGTAQDVVYNMIAPVVREFSGVKVNAAGTGYEPVYSGAGYGGFTATDVKDKDNKPVVSIDIDKKEVYWYYQIVGLDGLAPTKDKEGTAGSEAFRTAGSKTVTVTATPYWNEAIAEGGTTYNTTPVAAMSSANFPNTMCRNYALYVVEDSELAGVEVKANATETGPTWTGTKIYVSATSAANATTRLKSTLDQLRPYVIVKEMKNGEAVAIESELMTKAEYDKEVADATVSKASKNYYVFDLVDNAPGTTLTWGASPTTGRVKVEKIVYDEKGKVDATKGSVMYSANRSVKVVWNKKEGQIDGNATQTEILTNPVQVKYTAPEGMLSQIVNYMLSKKYYTYYAGKSEANYVTSRVTTSFAPTASEVGEFPTLYYTSLKIAGKEWLEDGSNDKVIAEELDRAYSKGTNKLDLYGGDGVDDTPYVKAEITLYSFYGIADENGSITTVGKGAKGDKIEAVFALTAPDRCGVTLTVYEDANKVKKALSIRGDVERGKVIGDITLLSSRIAEMGEISGWYDETTGKAWNVMTDPVNKDIEIYAIKKASVRDISSDPNVAYTAAGVENKIYNGKAYKPVVTVTKTVTENGAAVSTVMAKSAIKTTYYDSNKKKVSAPKNAGKYVAVITDKKTKAEVLEVPFEIEKARLSIINEQNKPLAAKYGTSKSGGAVTIAGYKTIKVNGATAKYGVDYTYDVSLYGNRASVDSAGKITVKENGAYVVTVVATSSSTNFTGSALDGGTFFMVYAADKAHQLKSAKVTGKKTLTIDGSKGYVLPITVTAAGQAFYTKGYDDESVYTHRAAYDDEVSDDVAGVRMWVESKSDPTWTIDDGWVPGKYVMTIAAVEGNDYGLVGEKQIVYTVKADKNHKLTKKMFNDDYLDIKGLNKNKTLTYNGQEWTLEDIMMTMTTDTEGKVYVTKNQAVQYVAASIKGDAIYGKDFTVEYKKNIDAGTATATFKALPNSLYSGSFNVTYKIQKVDLKKAAMTVGDAASAATDDSYVYVDQPTIAASASWTTSGKNKAVLTDAAKSALVKNLRGVNVANAEADANGRIKYAANGVALVDTKDFTMGYKYNKSGLTSMTVKGKKNYTGSIVIPLQ